MRTIATHEMIAVMDGRVYSVFAELTVNVSERTESAEHFGWRGSRSETEIEIDLDDFAAKDQSGNEVEDRETLRRLRPLVIESISRDSEDIALNAA